MIGYIIAALAITGYALLWCWMARQAMDPKCRVAPPLGAADPDDDL